jgi:hypothetical protein
MRDSEGRGFSPANDRDKVGGLQPLKPRLYCAAVYF